MEISSRTRVCALIGDPVEHSLSPIMQNKAFNHLGLDFVYVVFEVKKTDLEKAIEGVRSLRIHGLNVTKPLKVDVVPYLDVLDENALEVGAVNTVLNMDGRLIGYNTDGKGALEALRRSGVDVKDVKVVILGAGGASRAISHALVGEAREIVILNRTVEKAAELAERIRRKYRGKVRYGPLIYRELKKELKDAELLVNATSVGMAPYSHVSPVERELLRPDLCVFDLVYNPVETKLLLEAKDIGAKIVDGLSLLVHQGALAFEIWTGKTAPIDVMREAVRRKMEGE